MTYEDTNCPCGSKKPCDTMLCDSCEADLASHPSMKAFKDGNAPLEYRRHAAIILCSASRSLGRERRQPTSPAANPHTPRAVATAQAAGV